MYKKCYSNDTVIEIEILLVENPFLNIYLVFMSLI